MCNCGSRHLLHITHGKSGSPGSRRVIERCVQLRENCSANILKPLSRLRICCIAIAKEPVYLHGKTFGYFLRTRKRRFMIALVCGKSWYLHSEHCKNHFLNPRICRRRVDTARYDWSRTVFAILQFCKRHAITFSFFADASNTFQASSAYVLDLCSLQCIDLSFSCCSFSLQVARGERQ